MFFNYITYLFYGLAFFTLGLVILFKDKSYSNIPLSKTIYLFALFGIVHGIHEWLELYLLLEIDTLTVEILKIWISTKYTLLIVSYMFLLFFGLFTFDIVSDIKVNKTIKCLGALTIIIFGVLILDHAVVSFKDQFIRYFFGFTGAVFTGIVLMITGKKVRHISKSSSADLYFSGFFTICYGIASGIIPTVYVYKSIHMGMVRGALAVVILIFIVRSMKIFDKEYVAFLEDKLNKLALNEKLTFVGRLSAEIAHEINNPLTNASLGLEILKGKIDTSDETVLKRIDMIEKNIESASKIAKELLLYTRDSSDTKFELIEISRLIDSINLLMDGKELYKKVEITYSEGLRFYGSFYKTEEMLVNLLSNAIEVYNTEDKEIEISLNIFSKNGNIVFEVSDNGKGMTDIELKNAFEPFYTTKPHGKGTGLGLYICYNIVKLHNGDIGIKSVLGKGTTITVTIPEKNHG